MLTALFHSPGPGATSVVIRIRLGMGFLCRCYSDEGQKGLKSMEPVPFPVPMWVGESISFSRAPVFRAACAWLHS